MTEKRFTVLKKLENSYIEADVIDTYIERLVKDGKSVGWVTVGILDKGNPITYKDCVDLLNGNEQLKKSIKRQQSSNDECAKLIKEQQKENEQLKKELKVYRKLASCSNCDYHNYDWFDDGDEFEVCDKGNDVTEGICEEWEELS